METTVIVLKDEQINEEIRLINLSNPSEYATGPNKGQEFVKAAREGIVFILPLDVAQLISEGEVATLKLIKGTRVTKVMIDDVETDVTVPSLSYDNHVTFDALIKTVEKSGKITQLRNSFKVVITDKVDAA